MASNNRPGAVTQGGFWNGQRATYSKDTHDMLKTMMQESRLTNFQQRQLDRAVKSGTSLPSTCNPTSSAKPRNPAPKKVVGKVLNPRNYSSHVRSKDAIEASGAYEREHFQPTPLIKYGGYYEKDKQRLSNIMAFGEDISPAERNKKAKVIQRQKEEPEEKHVDRFQELQEEIEDRRKFLGQMESLGQGDKYRGIIETEISQVDKTIKIYKEQGKNLESFLVREMELIDHKKNEELQQLILAKERHR